MDARKCFFKLSHTSQFGDIKQDRNLLLLLDDALVHGKDTAHSNVERLFSAPHTASKI